jgi:hypothetical protein
MEEQERKNKAAAQRRKRARRKEEFTVAHDTRRRWNDEELNTLADTEYITRLIQRSAREVKLEDDPLDIDEYKKRVWNGVNHHPVARRLVFDGSWYQRFKERTAKERGRERAVKLANWHRGN